MALSDLEVRLIVAGRDLERARAERRIDRLVSDDLHSSLDPWNEHLFPDERLPPGILRVHGHGDVGHDRLRTRCRDDHRRRPRRHGIRPRILDVVERVGPLDMPHLEIRVSGLIPQTPVHDPIGPVEVTLLVQADEVSAHRALMRRLHREMRTGPVEGAAEHAQLPFDAGAVVVHPSPHLLEELLAAELLAGDALLGELVLDDDLGDDPGVVRARHVQRRLTAHPVVAGHQVLVTPEPERVSEVQVTGDVRERQHHDEGLRAIVGGGREEAALLPPPVKVGLDGDGAKILLRKIER